MVKRLQTQSQGLYGLPSPITNQFPTPVVTVRAPTTADTGYILGQIWVDKFNSNIYALASNHGGLATWNILGSVSSTFTALSAANFDTTTAATATRLAANVWSAIGSNAAIDLVLTPKGAGGVTVSTGALTVTAGAITATLGNIVATAGNIVATLGDITATNGNFKASTAGKGLQIKEGANARMGQATLALGTKAVANTSVTANTRVILTRTNKNASTAIGGLEAVTAAGVGFTITALSAIAVAEVGDLSTVDWVLVEAL
jgi:hypothetical protein